MRILLAGVYPDLFNLSRAYINNKNKLCIPNIVTSSKYKFEMPSNCSLKGFIIRGDLVFINLDRVNQEFIP